MYGMETIAFNTSIQHKLETVQLKSLRKILDLQTTYINRTFSNDYVRHQVNVKLKEAKKKPLLSLTEYHRKIRTEYLANLITQGDTDLGTPLAFDHITLQPIDHGVLRVGQPRKRWYTTTLEDLWQETKVKLDDNSIRFASTINLDNPRHVNAMKRYAQIMTERKFK